MHFLLKTFLISFELKIKANIFFSHDKKEDILEGKIIVARKENYGKIVKWYHEKTFDCTS